MHALIVLGGEKPGKELLEKCAGEAELIIAADSGMAAFDGTSVLPDLLLGDMDSVEQDVLDRYEKNTAVRRLNCIKDNTDGEDALDVAIEHGATQITMLGALGGRLDHALGNVMILVRAAKRGVDAVILGEHDEIRRVNGECIIRDHVDCTVSFLPLGCAQGVTLKGFFYPLEEHTMTSDNTLGISNVVTENPARASVRSGDLIMFLHDKRL